jgi:hypothetical protein
MKNVFMRERPSSLPDYGLGHSFPSGHVMNSTLAALTIIALTAALRHRRRWWMAAAVLASSVTAGRLLLARHWLLDAVGSGLAAFAVIGLCLPAFRRRPFVAPAGVAVVLAAVLAADLRWRALEIRLPSPLSARAVGLAQIDVGKALGTPALGGEWEILLDARRSGAWLRGPGVVRLVMPETGDRHAEREPASRGDRNELVIAGRPGDDAPCAAVRIALNGRALRAFVPFSGWREYRLPLPANTLRPGANEVRIEFTEARNPAHFAILYLRVTEG